MSVAITRIRQVASTSGKCSFKSIAMLKGSCPVEQAADQITSCRCTARRSINSASSRRSVSNGLLSRKNEVSCVIIALSTSRSSVGSPPDFSRSINVSRLGMLRCRTIGVSRATTR